MKNSLGGVVGLKPELELVSACDSVELWGAVSIELSVVVNSGWETSVVLIVSWESEVEDDFEEVSVEIEESTIVEVSDSSIDSVVEVISKVSEVSFLVEADDWDKDSVVELILYWSSVEEDCKLTSVDEIKWVELELEISYGNVVVDSDWVRSEVDSIVLAVVEAVDGLVTSGGHGRVRDVERLIVGRVMRTDESDELSDELGVVSVDTTDEIGQVSEVDSSPNVDVDGSCDDVSKLVEDILCWSLSVE